MKVMTIFGTRPEAIKMAPVIHALDVAEGIDSKVCVTAQHRHMLDQVMDLFDINPDFDLDIMKSNQGLTDITASVLFGLREVFQSWRPDLVLVHGDTTTTFAGSLAAYYEKVPVAHVEAGLRTGNIYSPWPEEINRRLTGAIATIHFAPTETARENLLKEGVKENSIKVTGNTVIDALLDITNRIRKDHKLNTDMRTRFNFLDENKKIILITSHRRENFGEGIINICAALKKISERKDVQIVFPVHPNPNVKQPILQHLNGISNIHLIGPQEYLPFVYLMDKSYLILTDSGGIQEEAPSLGKPVLVLRQTTERPEAVTAGTVKLVGTDNIKIIKEVESLLDNIVERDKMSLIKNPYGDGCASKRIISTIKSWKIKNE
jgi:UDP-N-acetylglucosamine 2-epimerase (non-hydrolysing)